MTWSDYWVYCGRKGGDVTKQEHDLENHDSTKM